MMQMLSGTPKPTLKTGFYVRSKLVARCVASSLSGHLKSGELSESPGMLKVSRSFASSVDPPKHPPKIKCPKNEVKQSCRTNGKDD
eukprot:4869247-Amphidinium_carterae.1